MDRQKVLGLRINPKLGFSPSLEGGGARAQILDNNENIETKKNSMKK